MKNWTKRPTNPDYVSCRTIGEERYYKHDGCSDHKPRLYVKFLGNRWIWHCHNCGNKGVWFDGIQAPKGTLDRYRAMSQSVTPKEGLVKDLQLPHDICHNYPAKALVWIKPTGVTNAELQQYGIVWSPSWNRLIFPIYSNEIRTADNGLKMDTIRSVGGGAGAHDRSGGRLYGDRGDVQERTLVSYQARSFEMATNSNPKYRNARQVGVRNIYFRRSKETSNNIVIVEDILSAIKVGRYCNSVALLGSYIPDELITKLQTYNKIFIWLDYDKLSTAYKYAKRIKALTGIPVRVIITKDDPKYVPVPTIKQQLEVSDHDC